MNLYCEAARLKLSALTPARYISMRACMGRGLRVVSVRCADAATGGDDDCARYELSNGHARTEFAALLQPCDDCCDTGTKSRREP